ncbi:hypothetical protein NDU88_004534 [Pleurodeles waltl]|uniref:Uncharacterized protein n=1 Tax=Pleurodeles waltl TaxID=8319 RepID=A0AAV7SJ57_PLEWA|nr:hypothetical protein NDU88_004534 [Pleurodeles waltl]
MYRGLCAGKKAAKPDLRKPLRAYEEVTKIQSQPEDSEDEDPNVGDLDVGELDLVMEVGMAVCPKQVLPEPSMSTYSSVSSKNVSPEMLVERKAEREFRLQMAKLKI